MKVIKREINIFIEPKFFQAEFRLEYKKQELSLAFKANSLIVYGVDDIDEEFADDLVKLHKEILEFKKQPSGVTIHNVKKAKIALWQTHTYMVVFNRDKI